MKDILLLNKDDTITKKSESKLKKKDLDSAKYILISTLVDEDDYNRNFIMVKPTDLFLFDKAIVDYQFCGSLITDCDEIDYIYFPPIHIELTSLTDLLNIINSADRLNVVNNLLNGDYTDGSVMEIITCYLQVRLIKDGNKIYEKYYQMKNGFAMRYSSYKVVARFDAIYTIDIMEYFERNHKLRLCFSNDQTWTITDDYKKYNSFGIPCNVTNTLTLLNPYEYKIYKKINHYDLGFSIYCEKTKNMNHVDQYFKNSDYLELGEYLSNVGELYHDIYNAYTMGDLQKRTFLMEILIFQKFIFRFIITFYDKLYEYNPNGLPPEYQFDSIIFLNIRDSEIALNLQNPVPFIPFLEAVEGVI